MRLFIPPLKTRLRLKKAWAFNLYYEQRNKTLLELLGFKFNDRWGYPRVDPNPDVPEVVALPKGSIISVDRIYIRQHSDNFDSVTFCLQHCPGKIGSIVIPFKKGKNIARFWAKLDDCNTMDVEIAHAGFNIVEEKKKVKA